MTLENIKAFLRENASRMRRISDRKGTSLCFNAFALVSDTYYRENFHSDVIRAILDPRAGHGEGPLFLKKFVEFITVEAEASGKPELANALRNLVVDETAVVVREEGRVDVKIKAPKWTIIVENKINGAGDMDRQIPRYVEKCCGQGEHVAAVVYLTASAKSFPSQNGWKRDDMKIVAPLLVPIIGFSETRSVRNLAEAWVGPCALAARGFHTKSILEQYAELLRHQSGETMNQDEIKGMLSSMAENGVQYSELLHVLQAMPHTLAEIIVDEFKGHGALKKSHVYSTTIAVLDLQDVSLDDGGKASIAIDVHCEDLGGLGISVFERNGTVSNEKFASLLREYAPEFNPGWNGRIVMTVDPDWAFGHIDAFLVKINGLLDHLEKNRDRLEAICRGESGNADG